MPAGSVGFALLLAMVLLVILNFQPIVILGIHLHINQCILYYVLEQGAISIRRCHSSQMAACVIF